MLRTPVNPWPWSVALGFNQAEAVQGVERVLVCSGQASVDAEGNPQHQGDMRGQIALALDNLETVLGDAGMTLSDVIRLNTYTTDVDLYFQHIGVLEERLGGAGVRPPATLLGVARLALPELLIEFEATAAQ